MASLKYETDRGRKGWKIRFRDQNKRQRAVWLGDEPEHTAREVLAHLEHLVEVRRTSLPPETATTRWLAAAGARWREKLANVGLVESGKNRETRDITLGKWLGIYISERTDVGPNTIKTYRKAQANLLEYFGASKRLRDITPADAKRWRIWVATLSNKRDKNRTSLSEATVRRRTGKAKQFMAEALQRGYITENPFDGLPTSVPPNEDRLAFVHQEWIEQCMPYCPDVEWRTILALCRYGGLRCPSELSVLQWKDVNLPERRFSLDSPKTGYRVCPIFPELRPYLEDAWDAAGEGAERVVPGVSATTNLRSRFEGIIKRAGLTPWPRLFHNLRASRETELLAAFPAKDVGAWLGHSVAVAMKHYAMATDSHFLAAAGLAQNGGNTGGNIQGPANVISNGGDSGLAQKNPGKTGVLSAADACGEGTASADSGRNRSRICDLLHVKQAL